MFVFSIKASTLKIASVICLSVIALIVLLNMIPVAVPTAASLMYSPVSSYSFNNVKSNDDRINFLKQFGWETDPEPTETVKATLPTSFDKIFIGYNELQKQQGLDLSKYKGKSVTRYTYKINNFNGYDGTVYANVIVYRGKVVGGDVCSGALNGFVMTLDGKTKLP